MQNQPMLYNNAMLTTGTSTNRKVILLLFLINLFLISPLFLPNLSEINPWDEANYINKGRELVDLGQWPNFAGDPLVSIFYAVTYLPYQHSPYWLVQSCSLGRVILFTLLWWSAYLVASRLKRLVHPGTDGHNLSELIPSVMVGLLLVTPLSTEMLSFPSDPLFASLAGFGFWQLLSFYETRQYKHLGLASMFMSLAALSRNDGLILFAVLVGLVVILTIQEKSWRASGRALLAVILPFFLLIGGYVLFYGLRTGSFELGTMDRTYENFEAGQQVIYGGSGELSAVVEAKLEAQRVFGSAEDNNYSVFTAIRRHPQAYVQRLVAVAKSLPEKLLRAYGLRFAPILFLLALRGIIELVRQKKYMLLLLFCAWPLHLVTGFAITLFRTGHLQFPFYVVFALVCIGLTTLLQNIPQRGEAAIWLVVLLGLIIFGLVGNKLAIFYAAAVFLASLLAIYLAARQMKDHTYLTVALFILLAAGLILHGDYPSPKLRTLGAEAKEQAVVFMANNLEAGSLVASSSPGPVWMAKMKVANLTSTDVPTDRTPEEFLEWLRVQDIQAIYVDHTLYANSPRLWDLLKAQIGQGLERVFSGDEGDIQVLLVK
jgi:hypothetical protein